MTRRRAPVSSPLLREELERGSTEWCRQTVNHARTLWAAKIDDERRWASVLNELRAGRAWKPLGHRSLSALLRAEIGVGVAESQRTVKIRQQGGDRHSVARPSQPDIIRLKGYGTKAAYLRARMERDADTKPQIKDILDALNRGTYRSVRAAAIAAGIITPPTTLERLTRAWQAASDDDRRAFLKTITLEDYT